MLNYQLEIYIRTVLFVAPIKTGLVKFGKFISFRFLKINISLHEELRLKYISIDGISLSAMFLSRCT